MPTTNPRVNVTLTPSLDLLVERLAALQKVSKSQVLRELLEAAEPALQRAVLLMDAASKASETVRGSLTKSLTEAQDQLEAQLAGYLAQADQATGDLVAIAEAVRGRRAPGASMRSVPPSAPSGGRSTPRAVTRGVGSPPGGTGAVRKVANAAGSEGRKGSGRGRV